VDRLAGAGRFVALSTDRLIDALWGEGPPETVLKALRCMSRRRGGEPAMSIVPFDPAEVSSA